MCSCLSPLVGGTSVFQATSPGGLAELRIREEPSAAAHRLLCRDLLVVWDTPPVRMVGREQEFAQLVDMLHRAEIGAGGFAVLTGEAGIGRTRVVTEWAAEARRREFVVLMGRAIDSGGSLRPQAIHL